MRITHKYRYMLKDYGTPFFLQVKAKPEPEFLPNGQPAPAKLSEPEQRSGIILPLTRQDIKYAGDGTYTTQDVKLIVEHAVALKSVITYRGRSYIVSEQDDWTEYSDFFVYLCRRSSKQ